MEEEGRGTVWEGEASSEVEATATAAVIRVAKEEGKGDGRETGMGEGRGEGEESAEPRAGEGRREGAILYCADTISARTAVVPATFILVEPAANSSFSRLPDLRAAAPRI